MTLRLMLSRAAVAALCILSAEEARAFVTAPTGAPFHARLRGASAHRRQGSVACGMQLGDNDAGNTPPLPSPDVIMGNVFEGKLGARGELYVGLQFALVFMVIIAPAFEDAFFAVGLFAGLGVSAAGLTLGYAGVRQLGDSLSPWPKPVDANQVRVRFQAVPIYTFVKYVHLGDPGRPLGDLWDRFIFVSEDRDQVVRSNTRAAARPCAHTAADTNASNQLQTTGAFSLCRHPIYGGLLITCVGLSLVTASFPRLLFSAALLVVMDAKAEAEEKFLKDRHGEAYSTYCASVPRFLPRDLTQGAAVAQALFRRN